MPLPVFDKLEDVPEQFRGEYELRDGKAHPKPPVGDAGRKAIDEERAARQAAEEARKAAEKTARDEKKRADDLELQRQADAAKIPAEQLEQWKRERDEAVAAEQEKTRAAEQKLEEVEIERSVRALAILPDVNMYIERLDADIMPLVVRHFARTEAGALAVRGPDGKLTTDDPKAKLLTLKTRWPFLFRGAGSNGAGGDASSGGEGGSGYDPVAAGKAAAAAQKQSGQSNDLAFR